MATADNAECTILNDSRVVVMVIVIMVEVLLVIVMIDILNIHQ